MKGEVNIWDELRDAHIRYYIDTTEKAIHDKLVELGWSPPRELRNMRRLVCKDCGQSQIVKLGSVFECLARGVDIRSCPIVEEPSEDWRQDTLESYYNEVNKEEDESSITSNPELLSEEEIEELSKLRGSDMLRAHVPPFDTIDKDWESKYANTTGTISAKERQVAGGHYKKYPIQPFEYCYKNQLNNLQSEVISYVTRYKDKGGIEDLKKAIHTLELLIEVEADEV